jgi:hypothetical protein
VALPKPTTSGRNHPVAQMIPSKIIFQRQFAKKDNDHAPEFQTCDHWQKNKLVRLFHTDLHTRNKRNL